ncbi:MAG: 1-deoxy-D-xylulose-5-phosphate reductoisomerase [Waddliaceae bacterium]
MKKIALLGSTGSIGSRTLTVARHLPDDVQVVALAAKSDIDTLEQQAKEFHPKLIAVYDCDRAKEIQKRLPQIEIAAGLEGLNAVAAFSEANFVVSAISGTLGLAPTLAAIKAGKDVGLANKEALVSGGGLVMSLVREKGVNLIPIDSEHSAIFQCLNGESLSTVRRLILTSSGGPFRRYSSEKLQQVTVEEALSHPTWKMGPKVTVDSSTLMNKGLELIEAHWLFSMPTENIEIIIHPQSIIHSMVEFFDGAIMAQMGVPEMVIPIQYALTYPQRKQGLVQPFDFASHGTLQFFQPDVARFRCLRLAFDAIEQKGTLPCYMNAANEVLVNRFLRKEISWMDISTKLEDLMHRHRNEKAASLDVVIETDRQARKEAANV